MTRLRTWRTWCALLTIGVVTSMGVPARADPPSARLAWVRGEGASSCPDGETIARAVSTRLGSNPFGDSGGVSIEASVVHAQTRWSASIYARGPGGSVLGERTIDSDAPDCASIADAAALAIALAIDPTVALRAPPEALAPAPPTPPAPAPITPPPPVAPAPVVVQAPPARTVVTSLRGVGVIGLVPGIAPGVALAVDGAFAPRLHAFIAATFLPEASGQYAGTGYGWTAADVGFCGDALVSRRMELALCAGVLVGVLHSVVRTLEPAAPGDRVWVGAEAGLRWRITLAGPWTAEAGVGGIVPITQYQFTAAGHPQADFSQSVVAGEVYLGLGVSIP